MRGPAAAEVTAAAAAAAPQKLRRQLTQLAAGQAAAVWVEMVGQWAAG